MIKIRQVWRNVEGIFINDTGRDLVIDFVLWNEPKRIYISLAYRVEVKAGETLRGYADAKTLFDAGIRVGDSLQAYVYEPAYARVLQYSNIITYQELVVPTEAITAGIGAGIGGIVGYLLKPRLLPTLIGAGVGLYLGYAVGLERVRASELKERRIKTEIAHLPAL